MTTYTSIKDKYMSSHARRPPMPRWAMPLLGIGIAFAVVMAAWALVPSAPAAMMDAPPAAVAPAAPAVVAESVAADAPTTSHELDEYRRIFGAGSVIELTTPGTDGPRVLAIGHTLGNVRPGPQEVAQGSAQIWVELPASWDTMSAAQRQEWQLFQYRRMFGPVESWR